ncbi:putative gustatory receptor clone PTE03 [Gambusia affinis]|uniref:putative gustatory receptor clone PTE03 n=1 Tax=Gambusia affinis TaxID=33528 RepID=UPI001CDBEB34|nr:putative gustatory receptor clone PTE03 [Gambusia affinis]
MSANSSSVNFFILATLGLPPTLIYPAFIFGTLTYLFIIFCNSLVVLTIAVSKRLHTPMFLLLINLPISDILGASSFFPQLVFSILTQNRIISSSACITQAFLIHLYGGGNLLILSVMAYDRYVAICNPLKYNTIMTTNFVIRLIFLTWFLVFVVMAVLFALTLRFNLCRTNIEDLYCNNPSFQTMSCGDNRVSNYYGLFITCLLNGGPLLIIAYTYAQILRTCIMNNNTDSRKKAFQTCGTHLVVFLVLQINSAFTIVSHRFQNVSPFLRRACGVSILIFPPFLDPIIYGLKTKELKKSIIKFLKRQVGSTK